MATISLGDLAGVLRGVDQRVGGQLPGERGSAVVGVHQPADALEDVLFVAHPANRGEARLLLRPILHRRRIEHQRLALAVWALHALVEALATLVADPARLHHLTDEARQLEELAIAVIGQVLVEVVGDVGEGVEAGEVGGAEGGRARAAHHRAEDGVHLFDLVALVLRALQRLEEAVAADAVGDEVGGVGGEDDALAQPLGAGTRPCRPSARDRSAGRPPAPPASGSARG